MAMASGHDHIIERRSEAIALDGAGTGPHRGHRLSQGQHINTVRYGVLKHDVIGEHRFGATNAATGLLLEYRAIDSLAGCGRLGWAVEEPVLNPVHSAERCDGKHRNDSRNEQEHRDGADRTGRTGRTGRAGDDGRECRSHESPVASPLSRAETTATG